jgi:hypothetical protein
MEIRKGGECRYCVECLPDDPLDVLAGVFSNDYPDTSAGWKEMAVFAVDYLRAHGYEIRPISAAPKTELREPPREIEFDGKKISISGLEGGDKETVEFLRGAAEMLAKTFDLPPYDTYPGERAPARDGARPLGERAKEGGDRG